MALGHLSHGQGGEFKSQIKLASQVALVGKNSPVNAGDMRYRFDPWVGKIPWWRAWQPTPVLLPGESHRQRSLAGYSPQSCKESDMTKAVQHACTHTHRLGDLPAAMNHDSRTEGSEDLPLASATW